MAENVSVFQIVTSWNQGHSINTSRLPLGNFTDLWFLEKLFSDPSLSMTKVRIDTWI